MWCAPVCRNRASWPGKAAKAWRLLARGPAAIEGEMRAGHLCRRVRAQEHRGLAQLLGRDEIERRLLFGQQFARCGFDVEAVLFGQSLDLTFHQGGTHPARADGVAGNALTRGFERGDLGEPHDALLGGNIGRLLYRSHLRSEEHTSELQSRA